MGRANRESLQKQLAETQRRHESDVALRQQLESDMKLWDADRQSSLKEQTAYAWFDARTTSSQLLDG